MGLFDFFKKATAKKASSEQLSISLEVMEKPISPEEYNRKREIEQEYLESKYDFNSVEGINAIPVSVHEDHPELICGVTGNIEYFLQFKAAQHEKDGRVELALACYRKSNEIMPLRGNAPYGKERYMRLPKYLRKLRRFDEARAEEEKIKKHFDSIDFNAIILKQTFRLAKERGTDLLVSTSTRVCCSECAKYRNRVYSISGKSTRFQKLPPYLLDTKRNCCISLHLFYDGISSIQNPSGKTVNPVRYSKRPFIDDRSEDEKNFYLKTLQQREEDRIRELVSEDYDWVWEFLPELCPKSRSAYSRMRNMNSERYKQIVQAAAERGKILTPPKTTPPNQA